MRLLIALIVIAALGWSAYWWIGARALDRSLRAGILEARNAGVEIGTEELRVTGFPNRFDTMVDAPSVTLPASGLTWSAPFLQIFALSYRPNQVIAVLPPEQRLTGPFGEARITSDDARASATFQPSTDLPLDHANLVAENIRIVSAGVELSLARLLAATRQPEGREGGTVHDIGITLDDLDLPTALATQLGGPNMGRIDGATLNAIVTFDAPLDRTTLTTAGARVERIEIDRLDVDWAGTGFGASGTLDVAADGTLSGTLDTSLAKWPNALDMAVATGLIAPDRASSVRQGLGLISALSGDGDRLSAPLELRGGAIYLGPVPLGPAPRLR